MNIHWLVILAQEIHTKALYLSNCVNAEDLTASDIAGTSVTIGWTVANRRVSHEYVVHYGTSQDSLDMESSEVDSISSSPGTDESYEVDLTGLTPDTTYYYQVVTTLNGFTFESSIDTFETLEIG